MNIQIIADNFVLSENTKNLVNEKIGNHLDHLLQKFAPEFHQATVHIQKDKLGKFNVNVDMNLPGKTHIFAKTTHVNFESALVDLAQEVEKQIKRYKDDQVNYSLG